jgi:hypothetical protein
VLNNCRLIFLVSCHRTMAQAFRTVRNKIWHSLTYLKHT